MSREALAGGGAVATRYVVPKVSGDAGAAFHLAVAYQDLADDVQAAHDRVAAIIGDLSGSWRGLAHQAIEGPVEAFLRNSATLVRALDQAADLFNTYGTHLEKAHEHHGFSMHKLLAVGAITAVSAAAIVVTVGVAGAVEAGAAAAAVGGASDAAAAATGADVIAAGALDSALGTLAALRPLLSFVLPQLLQVEWVTGSMAAYEEAATGRIEWRNVGENGAVAFIASGVAAKAVTAVGDSRWLPYVVEGATWAGASAASDGLTEHRFVVTDVAESFVFAGSSTFGRDMLRARGLWPAEPDYRRSALIKLLHRGGRITDPEIARELAQLRQPVRDLERGAVDLHISEGPGDTLRRHVARTTQQLLTQVRSHSQPLAATYWDEASAREAIQNALTGHRAVIQRWLLGGATKPLRLYFHSAERLGFTVDRHNLVRFTHGAVVVLARDGAGVIVVTSHPVL
jgi:uncharacterized protein YukE